MLCVDDISTEQTNPAIGINNLDFEDVNSFETLTPDDCVRVEQVRRWFIDGNITIEDCMKFYKEWLKQHTYLVLKKIVDEPNKKPNVKYIFTKTKKRGNDVYARWLRERYKEMGCKVENLKKEQVKPSVEKSGKMIKSNCIYGTLTFNRNKISLLEAWLRIEEFWNRFLSRLKRKFQYLSDKRRIKLEEIYVVGRCWEAHKSGYPHIHFVIVFRNTVFLGFERKNKKGKTEYRLNETYRQEIKSCWENEHGFADLQIPYSNKNVREYLFKYITKSVSLTDSEGKDNLTLCMTWVFGKRMFSTSKYVWLNEENPSSCYNGMNNSNNSLQYNLKGEVLTEISYEYVGIATTKIGTKWYFEVEKLPENLKLRRQKQEYYGIRDMGFS